VRGERGFQFRGIFGHARNALLGVFEAFFHLRDARIPGKKFHHGAVPEFRQILRKITYLRPSDVFDRSLVGLGFTGEDAKQSSLARPVIPDQSGAGAVGDEPVYLPEYGFFAEGDAYAVDAYQRGGLPARA
jgi:hypothetical protein